MIQNDQKDSRKPYWASVPAKEIADEILDKRDKYYQYLSLSGRLDLYRRSWAMYYRARLTGARINAVGQQGELTAISINQYRNLLVHLETMTTQQRASWEPRASNSDVKSQSQVILATGLLDYYSREKRLERNMNQAVKECLQFADAFVRVEWDATGGEIYGQTETGAPIYQGDLKYTNYMPIDVIRDFTQTAPNHEDWIILRDFQNKYTLAAKFPDLAEEILDDSTDLLELAETTTLNAIGMEESDNIAVYTLLHRPTPALRNGRYTQCLGNNTVLMDGPLPYKKTHVYRIAPDEESGTIFGYSVAFDLLPVQEALDTLYSTALTNQATFGVQNILAPKGHDLSVEQLSGGLNLMEYDPKLGEPKALNLTSTPPEIFNFMTMLERLAETISGVNSVARGNPEASLKSGAALALVQSMAIQFSMNLQRSYAQINEDLGTGSIEILQQYAAVPRVAAITGKSNRPLMKEFTGEDLSDIKRVMVDMGNPMTRTTAGKVNLADALAERNMIENPDQYIQVMTTGRLEPVIEGKQAQLLLIKAENEGLAEGQPQRALVTDNHQKHVLEHSIVIANPEIRQDPNNPIVVATLSHIQEHLNMMSNPMAQQLLQVLHQEVIPSTVPQAIPGGDGGTANMLSATPPIVQEAQGVRQPNMPSPPAGTDARSAETIAQQGAQAQG
ncbi:MAG: hypothetical protein HC838_00045 [Spirulinaceae cyanobacterium RM2_2_10]|nr:hypothetical protein [Spirulinaceae cyanobacterium RM2_2_10]